MSFYFIKMILIKEMMTNLQIENLLLNSLDHIKNVQLLIVEFIISFNFKPTSGMYIYDKIY